MVDISYTIRKGISGIYFRMEFGEVTVSTGNTITFGNFRTVGDLLNVAIWKKSTGAALVIGIADNIVTITSLTVNEPCVYMVYGVKA